MIQIGAPGHVVTTTVDPETPKHTVVPAKPEAWIGPLKYREGSVVVVVVGVVVIVTFTGRQIVSEVPVHDPGQGTRGGVQEEQFVHALVSVVMLPPGQGVRNWPAGHEV